MLVSTSGLLRKAADALDDGRDPLTNPFLSENDVTLDQCFTLAEQLAIGARMVAEAIENPASEIGMAYFLMLARSA